eukprot:SAG22_NODE_8044_length_688_cov_0.601019_1_plen_184_part_00
MRRMRRPPSAGPTPASRGLSTLPQVRPFASGLGAAISGAGVLTALESPPHFAALRAALVKHKMLVLEAPGLTEHQQLGFGKLLGEVQIHPTAELRDGEVGPRSAGAQEGFPNRVDSPAALGTSCGLTASVLCCAVPAEPGDILDQQCRQRHRSHQNEQGSARRGPRRPRVPGRRCDPARGAAP